MVLFKRHMLRVHLIEIKWLKLKVTFSLVAFFILGKSTYTSVLFN